MSSEGHTDAVDAPSLRICLSHPIRRSLSLQNVRAKAQPTEALALCIRFSSSISVTLYCTHCTVEYG